MKTARSCESSGGVLDNKARTSKHRNGADVPRMEPKEATM
jgi:hypothetical protein